VRTTSGATAVQLAESVGGRRRIVRHVGSAHDEAELGLLMAEARRLVDGEARGELDLGMAFPTRRAGMLGPAAAPALFGRRGPGVGPAPVGRARVVKTSSALLFDVLAGVYSDLGFDGLGDDVFEDLVIARVVEPTSPLDMDRVLAEMGRRSASLSTRKRTLKRCATGDYRGRLAGWCFQRAATNGDVSLVLYDVTTPRTKAEKEDEFRKPGYSKDRSIDPQIVVGLLVDREGFPLEIGCFEGGKAEKRTIVPIMEQFTRRHGPPRPVVVTDAGMMSAASPRGLDEAGHRFIVGSRTTKAPIDLASHHRWHGDFMVDGQIIDTVTPKIGENRDNDSKVKAEPVWDKETHPGSWRAIWQYSAARFVRDNHTLDKQQSRAQAVIDGDKPPREPRFLKTVNGQVKLDQSALARARKIAGLKGYVTNMPADVMPASEVIAKYHDLWHVEQSFRMSKSDLAARPFFARRRAAIEAHLTIVFAALAVSRTIQARAGLALRRVLRTLRPLRSAMIAINGVIQTIPPSLGPDEQALINDIKTDRARH
jgi:hypothetical protein